MFLFSFLRLILPSILFIARLNIYWFFKIRNMNIFLNFWIGYGWKTEINVQTLLYLKSEKIFLKINKVKRKNQCNTKSKQEYISRKMSKNALEKECSTTFCSWAHWSRKPCRDTIRSLWRSPLGVVNLSLDDMVGSRFFSFLSNFNCFNSHLSRFFCSFFN